MIPYNFAVIHRFFNTNIKVMKPNFILNYKVHFLTIKNKKDNKKLIAN